MSRRFRNDAVPLSGKLKAIASDIQRAQAAAEPEQKPAPRRETTITAKPNKKRSVEKMSKKHKAATRKGTADAARDRMISRHDGGARTHGGGADAARTRMIGRNAGSSNPKSAEAARAAMISRHDGEEDEPQQYVADMMRTNTGQAWKEVAQGEAPDEKLVAACIRDIYNEYEMERPSIPEPSADEARARMIERISGACPDRLPRDYDPQ